MTVNELRRDITCCMEHAQAHSLAPKSHPDPLDWESALRQADVDRDRLRTFLAYRVEQDDPLPSQAKSAPAGTTSTSTQET